MAINNKTVSLDDIIKSANPLKEIEKLNAQIYPAKFRVSTNDKLTKETFNLSEEEFAEMNNGETYHLVEKKKHKKVGKIRSSFRVFTGAGYINKEPLDEYDRDVLDACISNWIAGNRYITPAMIYRFITGKVNHNDKSIANPTKDQIVKILRSIQKLMTTTVSSDMTDVCKNLKYNDGNPFKLCSTVLPACYIEATINGQDATVILFDRQSPLLDSAVVKNKQLLTYPAYLIDVPNQNNTESVIKIKNYSLRRIVEIIKHNLTSKLTLDDILNKCGINATDKRTKQHARECLEKFFNHLAEIGLLTSFEWEKKGNKIYAIKFFYDAKQAEAILDTSGNAQNTTETKNNSEVAENSKVENSSEVKSNSESAKIPCIVPVFSSSEPVKVIPSLNTQSPRPRIYHAKTAY